MKIEVYTKANIIVDITNNSLCDHIFFEDPIQVPNTYIVVQSDHLCPQEYVNSLCDMIKNNKSICYNEIIVKNLIKKHDKAYFRTNFDLTLVYDPIHNIKQDFTVKHKINTNDFRYRSIWELFSSFILGLQRK